MRILVWIGLVIWLCTPALAATVVVRSGEHQGFTRLVLQIPTGTQWSLDTGDRDVTLNLDIPEVIIDTSQVFSRIGRARVTELAQPNPGAPLKLRLGCDCDVVGFVQSGSLLVVDLKDPKDPVPRQPRYFPIHAQMPFRFQFANEPNAGSKAESVNLPVVHASVAVNPEPSRSAPVLHGADDFQRVRTDINISEQRLLAQINRATTQGLLIQTAPHEPDPLENPDTEKFEQTESAERSETDLSNLIATTVVDRDMTTVGGAKILTENGRQCMDSEHVALFDWGDDRPFGAQVSAWRSNLYQEFDTVNPGATTGLARTYLYFGFGVEAKRALKLRQTVDADDSILIAMADILDDQKSNGQNPFALQQGCETDVALWSLLAEQSVSDIADLTAMQRAFARLPHHLRRTLGPRISQVFTDAGESEAAEIILRAVSRGGSEKDSAYQLAEAKTTRLHGATEKAADQLLEVVNQSTEHSPQAVVELVDTQWQNRGGISPDLPDLIAAYASEYRKTELGSELRSTYVVALALTGRHFDAFKALKGMNIGDEKAAYDAALGPALTLLTENADDVTFLQIGLEQISGDLNLVPRSLAGQMARRMLDLGFAAEAAKLLDLSDGEELSESSRLMRAEAALAQNLPHRAMIELLGVSGEDADKLRAAALWQIKDYQQAATQSLALEEIDDAARGFWLSDQRQDLSMVPNTHYGQISAIAQQLDVDSAEFKPMTPLAEARVLVEASQTVRNNISDLRGFVGAAQTNE